MMSEQALSEQPNSPIKLKIITPRDEWVRIMMDRRNRRNVEKELDRMAAESAFMDRYEQGFTTL